MPSSLRPGGFGTSPCHPASPLCPSAQARLLLPSLEAPAAGLGAAGGGRSMNLTSVRKGRQLGALPALHCRLGSSYGLEMLPAPWEGLGNRPWAGTGGGSKG